eukprot:4191369-Ditylum_brightwellii.AAC.1
MCTRKNADGTDMDPKGICPDIFKDCLQEFKKHYPPKNLAHLQKTYLCNYIKKLNKLSIKNTAVQLLDVNGMLIHFPAPGNNLIAEDKLCTIICHMIRHDWCNALHKSSRMPTDLSLKDFVDYFEQI